MHQYGNPVRLLGREEPWVPVKNSAIEIFARLSALCVTPIGVAICGVYHPEAMRYFAKPGLEGV